MSDYQLKMITSDMDTEETYCTREGMIFTVLHKWNPQNFVHYGFRVLIHDKEKKPRNTPNPTKHFARILPHGTWVEFQDLYKPFMEAHNRFPSLAVPQIAVDLSDLEVLEDGEWQKWSDTWRSAGIDNMMMVFYADAKPFYESLPNKEWIDLFCQKSFTALMPGISYVHRNGHLLRDVTPHELIVFDKGNDKDPVSAILCESVSPAWRSFEELPYSKGGDRGRTFTQAAARILKLLPEKKGWAIRLDKDPFAEAKKVLAKAVACYDIEDDQYAICDTFLSFSLQHNSGSVDRSGGLKEATTKKLEDLYERLWSSRHLKRYEEIFELATELEYEIQIIRSGYSDMTWKPEYFTGVQGFSEELNDVLALVYTPNKSEGPLERFERRLTAQELVWWQSR